MSSLTNDGKLAIDAADVSTIQSIFAGLGFQQPDGWIDANNRYRSETIKTLEADVDNSAVDNANLAEYISASGPLHCADGWSFLGRALTCHSHGDGDAARHFAYYAELRGAASLLATQGIGIFSEYHYAVDMSGTCRPIQVSSGTHRATWEVLEYWAQSQRAVDLLSAVVSPAGLSLADWLDAFGASRSLLPIGTDWLRSWGVDLQHLSNDRDARNEASYRPTRLLSRASLDGSTSASFLYGLWSLHEPLPFSRFEFLDRHLLRLGLELAHKADTDKEAQDDLHNFGTSLQWMLQILSPGGLAEADWKRFLKRETDQDQPELIREARDNVPFSDPRHHIQVIARATLLLRVATGACAQLLDAAGIGRDELEFWWKPLGEDRGLWEPGNEPEDLTELWQDVEDELENASKWEVSNGSSGSNASIARWLNEQSLTISRLGGCERIAFWGMGL